MKKILILSSTNDPTNGYGNITNELCAYLATEADVTLLLPESEKKHQAGPYKTEYVLPPYIFHVRTPKFLSYVFFDYPASQYDVIHSLFEFPYNLLGMKLAKKYKKPLIIGTQGTFAVTPLLQQPERFLQLKAYSTANVVTAPSVFTRDRIMEYGPIKTPISIIHNGVNFSRFYEQHNLDEVAKIRSQYPNKIIFSTVGGMKPRKGQDLVLKAFIEVAKTRTDFHYLLIGPLEQSPYLDSLRTLIKEGGLEKHVTFTGPLKDQQLVNYFYASDVYIHTPRVTNLNFEGFGIVYLEASACSKPIIATDAGGIRDAVVNGTTGIVVPDEDTGALVKAILKLMEDQTLREKLGNQGVVYAREHDWGIIGKAFLNLYNQL